MKAMVLAAGHGKRLRPLTQTMPKAMVEVGGKPLLEWQLLRLRDGGIREVVVNLGPYAAMIERHFGDGGRLGLRIRWSRESPLEAERLSTGGGIARALASGLLGPAPFLLSNADVWTEYPYGKLVTAGLREGQLAHLVMVSPPEGMLPDFLLGEDGLVRSVTTGAPPGRGHVGWQKESAAQTDPVALAAGDKTAAGEVAATETAVGGHHLCYAGIALLSPELLAGERAERFALREPLRRAVERGLVEGQRYQGMWCDVGTPQRLAWLREVVGAQDWA